MVKTILPPLMASFLCLAASVLADENCEQESRIGAGGGLSLGVLRLDTSPLEELAERDSRLERKTFDFDDKSAVQLGVMGYGGPRETARIGMGAWVAYKEFRSKPFNFSPDNDSISDSVSTLHVILPYAGFLAEKSFEIGDLNVHAGGLVGGGIYVVINDTYATEGNSAFRSYECDSSSCYDDDDDEMPVAYAPGWTFDLHAGVTYSILPWMHVGADASLVWMYSSTGFVHGYGSFWANNSALRIRMIFGNAG
ncbi:MAG: hypothetical protein ACOC41_05170 [Chitinivibrionales bacterium]